MLKSLLAAWAFYICLPAPQKMELDFSRITRWATLMGLVIGGMLAISDYGLALGGMPIIVRSTVVVLLWVWLTGGLHLDGAMDTADGLAVTSPERRLVAMADSLTGAFGVMSAIGILGLKVVSLSAIGADGRWLVMLVVPGWARWAQVLAVSLYPYLKAEGKGAMHSKGVEPWPDLLGGLAALVLVGLGLVGLQPQNWLLILAVNGVGLGLSYPIGKYFDHCFGGHTGDTYGAVVEWMEAISLCLLTLPIWYR